MKPFWPRTRQLLPVHLQARDTYVEELLQFRIDPLAPAPYGLLDLAIDDAAWARGSLTFKSMAAIFPSGLMVKVRQPFGRSGASLPRGPFALAIGVARPVLRGPNVLAPTAVEGSMRFRAQGDAAQPSLAPELRLLIDAEATADVEIIPLGRVERNGTRLQWVRGSVPVVARVRASAVLQGEVERLVAAMQQRKADLLRGRAERPFRLLDVAHQDLPALQLLAILQRYLPLVVEASRRVGLPPRELYDLLSSLYGSLTTFAATDRDPPPYAHDKLAECLPWLFAEIRTLVDEVARDRTGVLPFQRIDGTTYRLTSWRAARTRRSSATAFRAC